MIYTPATYRPPATEREKLLDPWWRLCNLYRVVDEKGVAQPFRPNPTQADYYWKQWYLNIILKSRQHGFTTLLCLIALDRCIFRENYHAHLIAQTLLDSEEIFETKIRWPLNELREHFPQICQITESTEDNARVLRFPHGSAFSCGVSMRGGTLQWLHISEHGKICAKNPEKAKEIRTGSLNTVHAGQRITIESTAEGRHGDFYEFSELARKRRESKAHLTKLDLRFHFYAWHHDPKNVLDPRHVAISPKLEHYFQDLRRKHGIITTPGQRAWYAKKRETQRDLMYREHPSTPEEAFQGATEGTYYGSLMLQARREGRIVPDIPINPRIPVDTSWDLGKNHQNAIWLHQYARQEGMHRWVWYLESHDKGELSELGANGPADWVNALNDLRTEYGFVWGRHYLPHDVEVSDWSQAKGVTRKDILEELGLKNIVTVERVPNLSDGIAAVQLLLPTSVFSERGCAAGIDRLESYRREWDERTESYKDTPVADAASDGADAFRQLAQEWLPETAYRTLKKRRSWRTA